QFALKGSKGSGSSMAISKDGTRIVVTGGAGESRKPGEVTGEATVWDARTGSPLVELKGLKEPVNSDAFSPDSTRILTAAQKMNFQGVQRTGGELKVWDATAGTVLLDLTEKEQPGTFMGERGGSVAFSADGRRFVTGGIRTVDTAPGE